MQSIFKVRIVSYAQFSRRSASLLALGGAENLLSTAGYLIDVKPGHSPIDIDMCKVWAHELSLAG